jgi:deoxyribonuclease V
MVADQMWPSSREELEILQLRLGAQRAAVVASFGRGRPVLVGAGFVCFPKGTVGPGRRGQAGWGGAVLARGRRLLSEVALEGLAGAPYEAGMLALREGPLLEAALRALPARPEVVIVNATGRDHPRRAGLALHLGAVLGLPTVGITDRPLAASGEWPADERGARSPLMLEGEVVGYWLRTRPGARPVAVHAAWRTDPESATDLVLGTVRRARTPEPLRRARRAARVARAGQRRELRSDEVGGAVKSPGGAPM